MKRCKGYVPGSIILNVVLLNFLHMVVTLWEIHPLSTISILLAIVPALENIKTYYFHAKSRIKHNGGNTIAMSQKGKHAHNRPLTPSNSRLKPNLGAISAYAGKKSN